MVSLCSQGFPQNWETSVAKIRPELGMMVNSNREHWPTNQNQISINTNPSASSTLNAGAAGTTHFHSASPGSASGAAHHLLLAHVEVERWPGRIALKTDSPNSPHHSAACQQDPSNKKISKKTNPP